ncbi:activating signal cointegrator 1, partial [Lecanoromycetidae sp. Uapishka_2]
MSSSTWAQTQLSQLMPLDEDSLRQILDYTSSLSKDAAAEHLKNLLGDSPKSLEFISSFNARREDPKKSAPASESPKSVRKSHQKKPPLRKLPPPRQPEDYGNTLGAYKKREEEDYMASSRAPHLGPTLANTLALSDQPDARQLPKTTTATSTTSKPPPSAAGPLISDLPNVRAGSKTSSRTSSPAPKTKINHRDKLLNYQTENARRTHIIDEAADFETPTSGQSMWSSPVERAAQLKKQQKVLREQEWNAKPEYEKRKVVVSVDLVGGKVVRRMVDRERPEEVKDEVEDEEVGKAPNGCGGSGGAFSKNPLLGGLIRPIWKSTGRDSSTDGVYGDEENEPRKTTWRRVQDDDDDNEAMILDGGIYGGNDNERRLGDEEHAQG